MGQKPKQNEVQLFERLGCYLRPKRGGIVYTPRAMARILNAREIADLRSSSDLYHYSPDNLGTEDGNLSLKVVSLHYGPVEIETSDETNLRTVLKLEFSVSDNLDYIRAMLQHGKFDILADTLASRLVAAASSVFGKYRRRAVICDLSNITQECQEVLKADIEGEPAQGRTALGLCVHKLVIAPSDAFIVAEDDDDIGSKVPGETRRLLNMIYEQREPATQEMAIKILREVMLSDRAARFAEGSGAVMVVPGSLAGTDANPSPLVSPVIEKGLDESWNLMGRQRTEPPLVALSDKVCTKPGHDHETPPDREA